VQIYEFFLFFQLFLSFILKKNVIFDLKKELKVTLPCSGVGLSLAVIIILEEKL